MAKDYLITPSPAKVISARGRKFRKFSKTFLRRPATISASDRRLTGPWAGTIGQRVTARWPRGDILTRELQ